MAFIRTIHSALKSAAAKADRYSRLRDRYTLDDRREGASLLVYLLIGYKPALWPFVIPRIAAAIPAGADVCCLSPGLHSPEVAEIARRHGWSYLATATNDVSLAQNVCLSLHPDAVFVCKIDEDMFLLPQTIARTLAAYEALKASGVADPAFMAPVIPLNGVCYRWVLERLGLLQAFEERFGVARLATANLPVQSDPAAARWIWRRTTPLEVTAERLAKASVQYLYCAVQFSIGLIVFERAFWEEIGMLPVHRRRRALGASTLGGDEAYLCKAAVEKSRPGVVTTDAFAGHFSFGPQYAGMAELLREAPELFAAPAARPTPLKAAGRA
jgi:hypothetical protein